MRQKEAWEVRLVYTAQLCPLHLTPDWRSSWWRSCSPLAFVCCIGNYLKSCGALCGKRIRFNARPNSPRGPSGASSIKVKCTCIGRHAPLSCAPFMPASLAEGIIFQHFMHCRHNEVAVRQTNRRIPSAESL